MAQNGNAEESISFNSIDESFDFLEDDSNQNSNKNTQQAANAVPSNNNNVNLPVNSSNAANATVSINQLSNIPIGATPAGFPKPTGINFNAAPMVNPPTIPPSKPSASGSRLLLKKTINKANESSLDNSTTGSSQIKTNEPSAPVSTHINNIEELDKDPPEPPKASIPVTIKPKQLNPPPIPSIPKQQEPPSIINSIPQAADSNNVMNSMVSGQSFSQGSSFELFTKMPPVPTPNQNIQLNIPTVSSQPQNTTPGKISVQLKPKVLLQKQQQQQQQNSSIGSDKSNIPLKKSEPINNQPLQSSSLMNSSSTIEDSIQKAFSVPLQNKNPTPPPQLQQQPTQAEPQTQSLSQPQAIQPVQPPQQTQPMMQSQQQPSQLPTIEKKEAPKQATIPIKLKVRALQKPTNSQLGSSMIAAPPVQQQQQQQQQQQPAPPPVQTQPQQKQEISAPLPQQSIAFTPQTPQIQTSAVPQQPQNFTPKETPIQTQPNSQIQLESQNHQILQQQQQQTIQQPQSIQNPIQSFQTPQQLQPTQQINPPQQVQQPLQQYQQTQQIQQVQPTQLTPPYQQPQQPQPLQQPYQVSQSYSPSQTQQPIQYNQQPQQVPQYQQQGQSLDQSFQQMQFSPPQQPQQQVQYGMQQPQMQFQSPYQQQQQQSALSSSFQFPSPPPAPSYAATATPPQVVYISPPSAAPYRPSSTTLVEQRFANSLDRSFSSFRRFFSAEFSMMMRQPSSFSPLSIAQNGGGYNGFDFDEYSESLSTEVSQIIESPVPQLDFNRTSLTRNIVAAIDEQTKPLTTVLSESNNRQASFAKTRLDQLKQLREELDSLCSVFKSNADSILKELEGESQNTMNLRNAQIAKQNDLEQRMRTVKLRQVELEAKATHQSVERDSLERQMKQLENRRRDWEDQNGYDGYNGYGYGNRDNYSTMSLMSRNDSFTLNQPDFNNPSGRYRQRILSEINALKKELGRDTFDDISKSIDEGLSMIRNESDNLKNELIDIDLANRWLMGQIQAFQSSSQSFASSFTAKPSPLPLPMPIPVPQMQPQSQTQLQPNASLLQTGYANTTTVAMSPVKKTGNQQVPSSPMTKAEMKLNMFRKQREDVVREIKDELL